MLYVDANRVSYIGKRGGNFLHRNLAIECGYYCGAINISYLTLHVAVRVEIEGYSIAHFNCIPAFESMYH